MTHDLRIGVVHRGRVLEERVLPLGTVTLGRAATSTFVVDDAAVPASVRLFEKRGERWFFIAPPGVSGTVVVGGREIPLHDRREHDEGAGEVEIDAGARGHLRIGATVAVLFHFVERAPARDEQRPRHGLVTEVEPVFTSVLVASLLLHAAVGLVVHVSEEARRPELEDLRQIVERIAPPRVTAPRIGSHAPTTPTTPATPAASSPSHVPAGGLSTSSVARSALGSGALGSGAAGSKGDAPSTEALHAALAHRGVLDVIGGTGPGDDDAGAGARAAGAVFAARGAVSDDVTAALGATPGGVALAAADLAHRPGGDPRDPRAPLRLVDVDAPVHAPIPLGPGPADPAHPKKIAAPTTRMRDTDVETVSGTVDKAAVKKTIDRRKDALQACYESALKGSSRLQGKIAVELTIEKSGRVGEVRVVSDGLHSDEVRGCVVSTLKRIFFPAPANGEVTVADAFVFEPGGGG